MSPLLPLPFVRTINSANLRGTSNVCRSFTSSLPRVPSPKALYIWNGVCRKRPRKPPGREEMISFGRKCGSQGGGKAIARNKCVMNLGAHGRVEEMRARENAQTHNETARSRDRKNDGHFAYIWMLLCLHTESAR